MARFERVSDIYRLFRSTRAPLSLDAICGEVEVSRATAKRILRFLREELGLPIVYDRVERGYLLRRDGELPDSLLGTWFSAGELFALLTAHRLLKQLAPGLLREETAELRGRLQRLLYRAGEGGEELEKRVRLSLPQARTVSEEVFKPVLTALVERRQIAVNYFGRARNTPTERTVSPLRLTFYRSNWYLAAWCHHVDDLRIFALDRITGVRALHERAAEPDLTAIEPRLETAYGIFEGEADRVAKLRFSPTVSRWVSDERWHPKQRSQSMPDGGLVLEVPYHHMMELMMDVLRYGPDVEVLAPPELRQAVARAHVQAAVRYAG